MGTIFRSDFPKKILGRGANTYFGWDIRRTRDTNFSQIEVLEIGRKKCTGWFISFEKEFTGTDGWWICVYKMMNRFICPLTNILILSLYVNIYVGKLKEPLPYYIPQISLWLLPNPQLYILLKKKVKPHEHNLCVVLK